MNASHSSIGRGILDRAIDLATIAAILAAGWMYLESVHGPARPNDFIAAELPADSMLEADSLVLISSFETAHPIPVAGSATTLVFLFRSDCPACASAKPEWLTLGEQARQRGSEVVGVTPESLTPNVSTYFQYAGGHLPVYQPVSPTAFFQYMYTHLVPTTILIGREGRILFHHSGLLNKQHIRVVLSTIEDETTKALRTGQTHNEEHAR